MKMKKGLGALALLLALTTVACGGKTQESVSGKSASTPVSSTSVQPSIKLTAAGSKTELIIGEDVQISSDVEGVTWTTSNERVATVAAGKVTAVARGTVTIKATKEGYKDGSISITVKRPAGPHPAEPTWPENCPELIDTSAWTAGNATANFYGKNYTPLTATDGSVGVKIAMTDYDPESVSTFDADGKLGTNADDYVSFAVKAPKAGVYQMILKASCSSSGDNYAFAGESSRGFAVKVNGYEDQANVYGTRKYEDANLDHDEKRPFIFALVQLSGPEFEDEIAFRNPYYRMKFDLTADVVFAENK